MIRLGICPAVLLGWLTLSAPLVRAQDTSPCTPAIMDWVTPERVLGLKDAPFSATGKMTFDQKLPGGNVIHGVTLSREMRDSLGRTRLETVKRCWRAPDGTFHAAWTISVSDVVADTRMTWDVDDTAPKVVTVTNFSGVKRPPPPPPLTPEQIVAAHHRSEMMSPPKSEFRIEDLGTTDINGISAEGKRTTRTIPVGEEGNNRPVVTVQEVWTSKYQGQMVKTIDDDPRRGRYLFAFQDVILREPDASLFKVPAGYTVYVNQPNWAVAAPLVSVIPATDVGAQASTPCVPGNTPFVYAGNATLPFKTGAPFTATVKWTFDHELADGTVIHAVQLTHVARDSAGRSRSERAQGCHRGEDGQLHSGTDVTVFDPATGTTTFWTTGSLGQKVARVSHRPDPAGVAPIAAPQTRPSAEEQAEALERQKLASMEQPPQRTTRRVVLGPMDRGGVSANGSSVISTIPAGYEGNEQALESVRERWVTKDLIVVRATFDDPRQGRSTFEFVDVSQGEPDSELFAPPVGYSIVDNKPVQ